MLGGGRGGATHPRITKGRGLIARPMMIADIDEHGDFWFSTDVESGKVDEIYNNSEVCITLTNASGNATVRGRASVVKDTMKINELWSETWRSGSDTPRTYFRVTNRITNASSNSDVCESVRNSIRRSKT